MSDGLMAALGFDAEDLQANREGQLSSRQVARLRQVQRRQVALAALVFLVFVVAATIFLYAGQGQGSQILALAGAALLALNAIFLGAAARSIMRLERDMRAGGVEALAGIAERVLRRGRHSDQFVIRIGGASLQVSRAVFQSFRHECAYRIYRSAGAGTLLSAEALD